MNDKAASTHVPAALGTGRGLHPVAATSLAAQSCDCSWLRVTVLVES